MNSIPNFESAEDLFAAAEAISGRVPPSLRHAIFLYFISRYFVAIFEARFGKLPLQVWNEYRNSLDHFYRHVTKADPDNVLAQGSDDLNKMEGHAQRAVLDICKISCHSNLRHLDDLILENRKEVLELVDNGEFYSHLLTGRQKAIRAFEAAKIADSALGPDAVTNRDVLDNYVRAVFSFDVLIRSFQTRADAIMRSRQQVLSWRRWFGFAAGPVNIAYSLVAAFIGFVIASILPPNIMNGISGIMAALAEALR